MFDIYKFGFNTQEKVDEVSGDGNHNTAEFWEYDTRLGRRWNLDPKPQVNISDYAVMGCNPVMNTDRLGDKVSYGSLKSWIDVAKSWISSRAFRKEFHLLRKSKNLYRYNRLDKKDPNKEEGYIELVKTNSNGTEEFDINYTKNNPNNPDGVGRSPYHGLFEETFHATDYDQKRSSAALTAPDASGKVFIGHNSLDQAHEARAWSFAAKYAPFAPGVFSITLSDPSYGPYKVYVYNTLISQIKRTNSNPFNPDKKVVDLLYKGYSVTLEQADNSANVVQSKNRILY